MGNQVIDQKQLKSDQFTTNYSKFLENVNENQSGLSTEEYTRAQGLYNNRTQSMKRGFKEVFNKKQKPEEVEHPDMTWFRQNLDDVKLERRMEKRGLLKSDVEVTNREEILGAKEVHRTLVREEAYKHNDMTAGIRRQMSLKLRADAGDYDTLKSLSEFYPVMLKEQGNPDIAKAWFERLVMKYGGQSEDPVENKKQRFEAMDEMTEVIMKIDLKSINLSSDEAIAMNAAKLERISGVASAYDKLIRNNPDYRAELSTRNNDAGENLEEKLSEKLGVLLAVSDYYRVKKLLIEDETYTKYLNSEIGMQRTMNDSFQMGRLKKLLRAAYYLGQNLAAKTRKGFMQVPLQVEENPYSPNYNELEAEDDTAMRLLSTDASYDESFEKLRENKVDALRQERETKEKELQRVQNEYDTFMNGEGSKLKEYKKPGEDGYVYNEELYKLDIKQNNLKGNVDYYNEEVKLIDAQIEYESNLTERQRIDRVINGLEAERLYVPQRWVKMSLDCPEKNDDPNYVYSTLDGYKAGIIYTEKTGRKEIRDGISKYRENTQLQKISFQGLPHRYSDPGIDAFDRILTYLAGPNAYGFTNQEMLEMFEILADASIKKTDEIKKDPRVKKYYESAYMAMVKLYHLQMYGLVQRIRNGLGDVPFALTAIDITHQMNCMLRMEMIAMSITSNPLTEANTRFVAQLFRDDHEGKYPVDMDDYDKIGTAYGSIVMGCQGYLDHYYNLLNGEEGFYTEKEQQKILEYCTDYREKHPTENIPDKDLYVKYVLEHPDEFNTRKKLYRKCETAVAEQNRVGTAYDLKYMSMGSHLKVLNEVLKKGKIRLSDRKKLLEYEQKLKKEHPELGWHGFKTKGEDDPFLIRRLLDNYEITSEEISILQENDLKPDSFSISELYEALLAHEDKKKQAEKQKDKAGNE